MLRILLTTVLFSLVLPDNALVQSSCALHIASFNIHYIVPNDKNDDWGERKHAVTRVLKDIDADIVAFQETETFDGGHYSKRFVCLKQSGFALFHPVAQPTESWACIYYQQLIIFSLARNSGRNRKSKSGGIAMTAFIQPITTQSVQNSRFRMQQLVTAFCRTKLTN